MSPLVASEGLGGHLELGITSVCVCVFVCVCGEVFLILVQI